MFLILSFNPFRSKHLMHYYIIFIVVIIIIIIIIIIIMVYYQNFHKNGSLTDKRLSQQPALGALTFLRSFVAGIANFCSQLLTSLVHFTVVKSQVILIIHLGVAEVISTVTLYLLPASK